MATEVNDKIAKIVEYYSDNQRKITNKYYDLIKWIGTSSLAFLPFFVALIPHNRINGLLLGLYISVVISIGIGLFSVCLLLFGQLKLEKTLLVQVIEALAEPPQGNNIQKISQVSPPFYYKFLKRLFLFSYIIFFVSFLSFCILIAI